MTILWLFAVLLATIERNEPSVSSASSLSRCPPVLASSSVMQESENHRNLRFQMEVYNLAVIIHE